MEIDKRKWLEYDKEPRSHWLAHPIKSHMGNDQFTHAIFCPGCECVHGWTASWTFNGDLDKPTISPSLKVTMGPLIRGGSDRVCHSFIKDGQIQFLDDCWHSLKGKTVDLEPF